MELWGVRKALSHRGGLFEAAAKLHLDFIVPGFGEKASIFFAGSSYCEPWLSSPLFPGARPGTAANGGNYNWMTVSPFFPTFRLVMVSPSESMKNQF